MQTLYYDTETTGVWHKDLSLDHDAQPNLVQLGAVVSDEDGRELGSVCCVIRPEGWIIPHEAAVIHGITDHRARAQGVPLISALALFSALCANSDRVVGHNLAFDLTMMERAYWQVKRPHRLPKARACTMLMAKDTLKIPSRYPNSRDPYKWPNLSEMHEHFFGEKFEGAHTALADCMAAMRCYQRMKALGIEDVAPRASFKPPRSSVKGETATSWEENRNHAYLKRVLTELSPDREAFNSWEAEFWQGQKERYDQYGERVLLTVKQWAAIEKLGKKYLQKEDQHDSTS